MGLYETKQKVASVSDALTRVNDELNDKLDNPSVSKEDLDGLRTQRADLRERMADLTEEVARLEAETKAKLDVQVINGPRNDAERLVQAKATFYRNTLLGNPVGGDVLNVLQAIPAGGGTGGESFIPSTLIAPIITEPAPLNPLRGLWTSTSVRGLEQPRLGVTVNDADAFIDDDESAGEVDLDGDVITWGRFKAKLVAKVSDSVVHGADASLVTTIEQSLRDALAYKELKCAFATSIAAPAAEEHMTFYEEFEASPVITEVAGTTQLAAIRRAIYALHPAFRPNARVAMPGLDWVDMLEDLINENATYVNAIPEQVLSKPMLEVDLASVPVVGDFSQVHINYDPDVVYDTDKDVELGVYKWVVTVWFDIQRIRNSAFRLAVVEASA
jgi:HK97 family phage major capsid protein